MDLFKRIEYGLRRHATNATPLVPSEPGDDLRDWLYRQTDRDVKELFRAATSNGLGERLYRVETVVACLEGRNDGPDWLWVVTTTDGVAYARGECDYTGWDCQSRLDWHDASGFHELVGIMTDDERVALAELFDAGAAFGPSSLESW